MDIKTFVAWLIAIGLFLLGIVLFQQDVANANETKPITVSEEVRLVE